MAEFAVIEAQIEAELKHDAEEVFKSLGITAWQAITLFYQQVQRQRGLPFPIRIPNETTRRTFEETDAAEGIVRAKDAQDLLNKLGI